MRISLVECEKLQYNVFSGKVDLQDILDILCMPLWVYLLHKLGESIGQAPSMATASTERGRRG